MNSKWRYLAGMEIKQAFGETMFALATEDEKLTVVVSDYGRRLNLDNLKTSYPEAFVQCGIAEQGQIEVAASLANEGFHVFSPAYAAFTTTRSLDQIRILLGTMDTPMCVVGLSAGFESGSLGASHVALEDIAVMRTIPGITVLCPSDNVEMACIFEELAAHPRPAYVRISGSLPDANLHEAIEIPPIGAACVLKDEKAPRVSILASGTLCSQALKAAELLDKNGTSARVVEFACVKPLDTKAIFSCCDSELIVTLEEHSVLGGFGSAVAEVLSAQAGTPRLLRLGTNDVYPLPDLPARLLEQAQLMAEGIAERIAGQLCA